MNELKTYKFYTAKKQRIAAYAFMPVGENPHIHVLLVFCSPKDHFDKKTADWVYSAFLKGEAETVTDEVTGIVYHPKLELIPVLDGKPKKTFLEYMKKNYYKKVTTKIRMDQVYLMKTMGADSRFDAIPVGKPTYTSMKLSNR